MSGPVLVDTNVLVYVRDRTEEDKQRRAAEWMALLWELRLGRVSVQVLQEYYLTVTEKLDEPRTKEEAREDVIALTAWKPIVIDLDVLERAWTVQDRLGFSWWDALIVAAALVGRCRYLLTEDLQDEQEVEGLTILNPFTHDSECVLRG